MHAAVSTARQQNRMWRQTYTAKMMDRTQPPHVATKPIQPASVWNIQLMKNNTISKRLEDFKTLFLSLEARKIFLRSCKWQIQTNTMAQTQTQDPLPPPPPLSPHTHTHTRKHVSMPVCRCEDISTPYYILRSTWGTMGEQKKHYVKNAVRKIHLLYQHKSDCMSYPPLPPSTSLSPLPPPSLSLTSNTVPGIPNTL